MTMKITLIANNITFSDIQQSRQRNKEFKSGKTNESFFLKKKTSENIQTVEIGLPFISMEADVQQKIG